MAKAADLVSGLLGKIEANYDSLPEGIEEQRAWLLQQGFSESEIADSWQEVSRLPVLSRQKERATELRSRFMAVILKKMGRLSHSAHRLTHLKEFLHSIRAKTSFYSLLLKNEGLQDILSEIFCSSPFLSRLLCSRPEIIDSVVMRNVDSLNVDSDWDDFLTGLADIKQLTEFLVGIDFLRTRDLDKLFATLSHLADDVVHRLWDKTQKENAASDMSIWALGKWGGQELGLFSDLDCIFVKCTETHDLDFKFLRRFLNRLTESHRGGSLYSIDTRLRTSSQTGILLTTESDILKYLAEAASPWERQAYLKARVVGQSEKSLRTMKSLLVARGLTADELRDLESIRVSLLKNKKSLWDLKYSEGGFIDVELAAQTALMALRVPPSGASLRDFLNSLEAANPLWLQHGHELLKNYNFMRLVEQELRLVSEESNPILNPDSHVFHSVSSHMQMTPDELEARLRSALKHQVEILNSLDPRRGQKYQ
jgi:glutamate-ammonia-ligase adenylyltransferase